MAKLGFFATSYLWVRVSCLSSASSIDSTHDLCCSSTHLHLPKIDLYQSFLGCTVNFLLGQCLMCLARRTWTTHTWIDECTGNPFLLIDWWFKAKRFKHLKNRKPVYHNNSLKEVTWSALQIQFPSFWRPWHHAQLKVCTCSVGKHSPRELGTAWCMTHTSEKLDLITTVLEFCKILAPEFQSILWSVSAPLAPNTDLDLLKKLSVCTWMLMNALISCDGSHIQKNPHLLQAWLLLSKERQKMEDLDKIGTLTCQTKQEQAKTPILNQW